MKVPFVFYTHSSYSDVMNIQCHYTKKILNKILITDKSNDENILKEFNKVFYYSDNEPYSQRLFNFLCEITDEYIILMHDNDILIEKDDNILEKCINLMVDNNYDRIDFQVGGPNQLPHFELIPIDDEKKHYLSRNNNQWNYIYNVNPSLWRVSTLKNILENFLDYDYRSIESTVVQDYCLNNDFKMFKLMGDDYITSSPFKVLPFFQYIHITHNGNFLPINNNSSEDIKKHYSNIVENFKLLEGNRKFDEHMMW